MSFKVVARFNESEEERDGEREKAGERIRRFGRRRENTAVPHPSRRISCHRLHRPLSSPAMKQMIKASTRML